MCSPKTKSTAEYYLVATNQTDHLIPDIAKASSLFLYQLLKHVYVRVFVGLQYNTYIILYKLLRILQCTLLRFVKVKLCWKPGWFCSSHFDTDGLLILMRVWPWGLYFSVGWVVDRFVFDLNFIGKTVKHYIHHFMLLPQRLMDFTVRSVENVYWNDTGSFYALFDGLWKINSPTYHRRSK